MIKITYCSYYEVPLDKTILSTHFYLSLFQGTHAVLIRSSATINAAFHLNGGVILKTIVKMAQMKRNARLTLVQALNSGER